MTTKLMPNNNIKNILYMNKNECTSIIPRTRCLWKAKLIQACYKVIWVHNYCLTIFNYLIQTIAKNLTYRLGNPCKCGSDWTALNWFLMYF